MEHAICSIYLPHLYVAPYFNQLKHLKGPLQSRSHIAMGKIEKPYENIQKQYNSFMENITNP